MNWWNDFPKGETTLWVEKNHRLPNWICCCTSPSLTVICTHKSISAADLCIEHNPTKHTQPLLIWFFPSPQKASVSVFCIITKPALTAQPHFPWLTQYFFSLCVCHRLSCFLFALLLCRSSVWSTFYYSLNKSILNLK